MNLTRLGLRVEKIRVSLGVFSELHKEFATGGYPYDGEVNELFGLPVVADGTLEVGMRYEVEV
jgi:hypothetical protein